MSEPGPGFETILQPLTPAEFFEQFWQKKIFVSCETDANRFSGLLSLRDIDVLIYSSSSPDDGRVVKARTPIPPGRLERPLALSAAYKAYQSGDTILLNGIERRWNPVGRLCRNLEQSLLDRDIKLASRIGANMYLTPKSSAGFPPHYDDHDVFILQLEGKKRWQIYGSVGLPPIKRQVKMVAREQLPQPVTEISLEPGHVIYIPRGVYHEAFTADDYSMHLTISIFASAWIDLVTELLKKETLLHAALPPVRGLSDGEFLDQYRQHLHALLDTNKVETATRALHAAFSERLQPLPDTGLSRLSQLPVTKPDLQE